MAELLTTDARSGLVTIDHIDPGAGQNSIHVTVPIDRDDLRGRDPVAVRFRLEQSPDGVVWWTLGESFHRDILADLEEPGRDGNPQDFWWRITEQVVRGDVYRDQHYENFGGYANKLDNPDGATYYQLALTDRLRLTVDAFEADERGERLRSARLVYGVDAVIEKRDAPGVPIGRRSASLVGIFASAEGSTGTSITSGSRTTTTGSLITIGGTGWKSTGGTDLTWSDSKSNAYSERFDDEFFAFSNAGIGDNIGGTRGTSHTVTVTYSVGNIRCITGQEWDGIVDPLVVTVGSANTGTSTGPSCSVTPSGGAALVMGMMCYDGSSTTMSVSDGTEASEGDEDNTGQAQNIGYKVAASGATTIGWTLGASRSWRARGVAYEETGGSVAANLLRGKMHGGLLLGGKL